MCHKDHGGIRKMLEGVKFHTLWRKPSFDLLQFLSNTKLLQLHCWLVKAPYLEWYLSSTHKHPPYFRMPVRWCPPTCGHGTTPSILLYQQLPTRKLACRVREQRPWQDSEFWEQPSLLKSWQGAQRITTVGYLRSLQQKLRPTLIPFEPFSAPWHLADGHITEWIFGRRTYTEWILGRRTFSRKLIKHTYMYVTFVIVLLIITNNHVCIL